MSARVWPLGAGRVVTSGFGTRWGAMHWGIDLGRDGGSGGMPVYAAQAGTVTMAGPAQGFGSWVVVDHPTAAGLGTTVYGHVVPEVRAGQRVAAGQRIARINPDSGSNGGVAPHLHFEVHRAVWSPPGPNRLDPLPWLAGAGEPDAPREEAPMPDTPIGLTPERLADAMGRTVSLDRYRQLFPAVVESLLAANCTTVNRAAMWLAQVGHESVGLKYMREIASGSAYEGRRDLGNTVAGDGVRFAGRGPIQITGRHNYSRLSEWAHGMGFVPTPTFFVDTPEALESDRYGFMGVTWYWTVARDMNSYADAADIEGATRAVNGGTNGLQDRITRWNRCRALGADILPIGDDMPSADEIAKALLATRVRKPGARAGLDEDGVDNETLGNLLSWADHQAGKAVDQLGGEGSRNHRDGRVEGWEQLGTGEAAEAARAERAASAKRSQVDGIAHVIHQNEQVLAALDALPGRIAAALGDQLGGAVLGKGDQR